MISSYTLHSEKLNILACFSFIIFILFMIPFSQSYLIILHRVKLSILAYYIFIFLTKSSSQSCLIILRREKTEYFTLLFKEFFRTSNVLPFSCTHLALQRQGKKPKVHKKKYLRISLSIFIFFKNPILFSNLLNTVLHRVKLSIFAYFIYVISVHISN